MKITDVGKAFLRKRKLKQEIEELEEDKKKLEQAVDTKYQELEMLGLKKEEVAGKASYNTSVVHKEAHVFAVTGNPQLGDETVTRLLAMNGRNKSDTQRELREQIPSTSEIHCHICELNEVAGTHPSRNF